MHSLLRKRGVMLAGLLALALAAALPQVASASPEPGAKNTRGFRLFARALGALTINRVYCGLTSIGEVCVDSNNSSTIGGGFWPKGTADQYVFNSGLQVAGIIGPNGGPWAGDTTGAFLFDPKGTTTHGDEVAPIYNTTNLADAAFIGDAATSDPVALAARVPSGDATADIFNPLLQGRTSASQGDVWWLTWDGNPGLIAGRPHPLGVMVEQRGMGWNYPSGNEDIVYFVYTFYNVTSANPADYAAVRPGMRDILIQKAQEFQQRNNSTFGVTLPSGGYTITDLYANFSADMDVGSAGNNYASVNVPFSLGYTYENAFSRVDGWSFDPAIFSKPFFSGAGFVGVKYLKSPEINGQEVGLTLFSNTTNGGGFSDPGNTTQLWRYVSGNINTAAGDDACNFDPVNTKICFIRGSGPFDMRFYQSSGPLTLGPGEFGSVVVAYIFAAPVQTGTCPGPSCNVPPGNPTIIAGLTDPAIVANGVNPIDSLTGFLSATDTSGNGILEQEEFDVVPGSLLGKARVAQAVFDGGFLLPFAPEPPEFFLVPGDNQVTVLWRPSVSETTGDPYYQLASDPTNSLYDPNYRQFDVEGYRVYRGRVDAPNSLTLLAQFDYGGTVISDYAAQVNPTPLCAPELAITTDCPTTYDPITPGVPRTAHNDVPLVGQIVQVKLGERTALADGTAIVLIADTAVTGNNTVYPQLSDNGVPFVYVDQTPRNNFRYFYSVTAFDINSFQSGPSNLESPRNTKPVTPRRPAANYENVGTITSANIEGRGVVLDPTQPLPTIDPTTGQFSGPFPPAKSWTIGFGDFVASVLSTSGSFSATLDSIALGSPYGGSPHVYWWTAASGPDTSTFSIPITMNQEIGVVSGSAQFGAVAVNPSLAARYGGGQGYTLQGKVSMKLSGPDYASLYGRGCVNGRAGFTTNSGCSYNGSRWFDGPSPANNETKVDPIEGNQPNFSGNTVTNFNNAGELSGVVTIQNTQAYQSVGGGEYRPVEGIKAGAHRAADYNVYWGSGGAIDSVIDVTHNVVVPFSPTIGGTWGVLNAADAATTGCFDGRTELTSTDLGCVEPVRSLGTSISGSDTYTLSQTVVPGPVSFFSPSLSAATSSPVATNAGFVLAMPGDWFTFELAGGQVPAAGTVWSLRQYVGAITGGNGDAGNEGPYTYSNPEDILPMTAVGATLRVSYDVTNQINAPTDADLSQVHTVPDPYYVTNEFEQTTDTKIIKFVNLPDNAIIRIYSSSGVLVRLLEHHAAAFGGAETWDVRNRNNQVVASGVYFYHIESGNARRVGRFTIVNFAQ